MANLLQIQAYLEANQLDGWLLYDFRGSNPLALRLARLTSSGSRRWFLWIPAKGRPAWLIHAIEGSTFASVAPELQGTMDRYVGWRELETKLHGLLGVTGRQQLRIAMEYSPENAIPYVSYLDAGTKELVERVTGAEIVSSADLVQMTQAVLDDAQVASHRRAAAHCLAVKDAAFALIARQLRAGLAITEYDVQQFIVAEFAAAGLDDDHPAIVAVNAHAADPHFAPTASRHSPIRPGDMVLIDLWARARHSALDCFADITWVGYCGREVPAEVRRLFALVAAGRDAAVRFATERLLAGKTVYGYEVDDACRAVIAAGGYGDAFIHRTGHSLGAAVHYSGVNIDNLETRDRRSLMPGVMFTVEPGIYLPAFDFDGSGEAKGLGLRTEINCLVHDGSLEVTTLPLQREVLALL
jgi:Xaa-Pro dipeptidase